MKRLVLGLCLVAVGCDDRSDPSEPAVIPEVKTSAAAAIPTSDPPAAPAEGKRGGAPELGGRGGESPPIPQGAMTLPNVGQCVAQCVDRNRMRAEAPEKIEADCRDTCLEACLKHCSSGSESELAMCKSDCERQTKR